MYHKLGKIPAKRHTVFRNDKGGVYFEELFGNEGFSGDSSLMYHIHRPTQIKDVKGMVDNTPQISVVENVTSRKFKNGLCEYKSDYIDSKEPLMVNDDLIVGTAYLYKSEQNYFYKNATGDELIFVHKGSGVLKTFLGNLSFSDGDYLIIPKGVIYQIDFSTSANKIFYIDSKSKISFPKRYLSSKGQFLEHAPICERDIRLPSELITVDQKGDFKVIINKNNYLHEVIYAHHPFDVVGWDGYCYPFAISIHDFEPITGSIHQPPTVHQIFEGRNFVVCSFCPRLFDYHPDAIPAPYHHSNIDSDEVLYYVEGDFMSRDNIECGDITLHPAGIPHGPHPGTIEASIGKKSTEELAVMVDPFNPFKLTIKAVEIEDYNYFKSWLNK